jgi:DNA-directed RNA polymerase subunit beta
MDVRVSSRKETAKEKLSATESKKELKRIEDEYNSKRTELLDALTEKLAEKLLNEKIPLDVVNGQTGEILIPANKKITKAFLARLSENHENIEIDPSPIRQTIVDIISGYEPKFADLDMERERQLDRIEAGDEVDPGIVKAPVAPIPGTGEALASLPFFTHAARRTE